MARANFTLESDSLASMLERENEESGVSARVGGEIIYFLLCNFLQPLPSP